MFGVQLYPSPPWLIEMLTEHLFREFRGKFHLSGKVLEPSAGRGDILDYISEKAMGGYSSYNRQSDKLAAIEIDPSLQAVLREKGYRVIDSDFLEYPGFEKFDHIVMNPPFKDGAKHLLKAFEISKGALIKCVLNAETIKNPYSQDRKRLLHLIEENQGEVAEVGQVFIDAERSTPVDAVIVTLQDKTYEEPDFLKGFDPEREIDILALPEIGGKEIASENEFEAYEARYNAAIRAFEELLLARSKAIYYMSGLTGSTSPGTLIDDLFKSSSTLEDSYRKFLSEFNREAWIAVFAKTNLAEMTTARVKENLETLRNEKGSMSFTANNMRQLFMQLGLQKEEIMTASVLDAFDEITKYYHENREAVEGWKTNSAYLVGRKFILPNIRCSYGYGISHYRHDKITDIEKALCFLDARPFDKIKSIIDVYNQHDGSLFGKSVDSEFFWTKFYKKGTLHFEWKDEGLRQRFNGLVAFHRWGELPEKVKTGVYS